METHVKLKKYQDNFLLSEKRYPAMIAGIATGKTYMLLLKAWRHAESYPDSLVLIVRKNFTDLRDSTLRDFERYFGVSVNADKDYKFSNKSRIMFRHGDEMSTLKNVNLSFFGVEQAEEFETDEQFTFLRDRLRRDNVPYRQGCIVANSHAHNWIYSLWIKSAHRKEIDAKTGQYRYTNGKYDCVTANTFANEDNLPADFIDDLRQMAVESPNHYKQYILNDHDVTQADDFMFTFQELEIARKREYAKREGYDLRLISFDIARYGNDKSASVCIQQMGALRWKVCYVDQWEKKDLAYTTGRIISTVAELRADGKIIDEDGMGAGNLDHINASIRDSQDQYKGFRNPGLSYEKNKFYGNPRTANIFKLKDLILKGHISLTDEDLCQELLTLRYTFMTDGRKILISKEVMRNRYKIKSPNLADALIMCVSLIGEVKERQDRQYQPIQPQYSKEGSLLSIYDDWSPFR